MQKNGKSYKTKASRYLWPAADRGDNRTRTCDPLHVKQMLSQLSYVSMRIF